jgi:hypothetical protein
MNARTVTQGNPQLAPPRFDRKFIEDHKLVERYLENKLPFKGARDLENWCRAHPEYLNELKLSERAQSSLKLLEAAASRWICASRRRLGGGAFMCRSALGVVAF